MRRLVLASAALLTLSGLAGCSGDNEPEPSDSASASSSEGASDYVPVPEGVELTPQGTELQLGEAGVLGWRPSEDRVGVVELKVTAFETVDIKRFKGWDLDEAEKKATPYFVRLAILNVGDTNLSGVALPLYLADGVDTLIPATTFESKFTPCPSQPLPQGFRPGERVATCLAYLMPEGGSFEGVRFYPGSGFDPISWSGQVTEPKPEQPDKKDQKKDKKDKSKQDQEAEGQDD